MNFFEQNRNEQHVFIYAVGGRTSSTALQRILNSSGEICIWGESWGLDEILLKFISDLQKKNAQYSKGSKPRELGVFLESFRTGVHDRFYPNALRPLDPLIMQAQAMLGILFEPLNGLKRMGYKEIRISNEATLRTLIQLFPNCKIVFLFRDPLKQWVSVRDTGWFVISKDIQRFVEEYRKRATIYETIAKAYPKNCLFLENSQLSSIEVLDALVKALSLKGYDKSLVNKIVSSVKKEPLTQEESDILQKALYPTYTRLKGLVFKPASQN